MTRGESDDQGERNLPMTGARRRALRTLAGLLQSVQRSHPVAVRAGADQLGAEARDNAADLAVKAAALAAEALADFSVAPTVENSQRVSIRIRALRSLSAIPPDDVGGPE